MRRCTVVVAVLLAAASCSKQGISESQCKTRAAAFEAWRDGAPEGYSDGPIALLRHTPGRDLQPPEIRRGWRAIDDGDPMYLTIDEVLENRSAASDEARAVYLIAGADAPLAHLEKAHAALRPHEVRLVVRRPRVAFVETHFEAFPNTPEWAREAIVVGSARGGSLDQLAPAISKAIGGCQEAAEAMRVMMQGAGIDVIGPAVAEALVTCDCEVHDVDAFESLLAFVLMPRSDIGWLPAAFSADPGARALSLSADATVGDLAEALAALPATEQGGPIAYTTDVPEKHANEEVEPIEPVDKIVEPIEPVEKVPEEDRGVEGGVVGGVEGGVVGGLMGGVPPPPPPPPNPAAPKIVPQIALEQNRIAGDKNIMPPEPVKRAIEKDGKSRIVTAVKMCVNDGGRVQSLEVIKSSGYPAYDARLRAKMRAWKYRPFMINGKPIAVCTSVTFIYNQK